MTATLHVPGIPAPQGSKKGFVNTHTGRVQLVESSARVKPWRTDVREAAIAAGLKPIDGPVIVRLEFTFPRPKSHYGTGKNAALVKRSAPALHTQRPDVDKLQRAVLDALTGIAWRDDSQVVHITASKAWTTDQPGVTITITDIDKEVPF